MRRLQQDVTEPGAQDGAAPREGQAQEVVPEPEAQDSAAPREGQAQ